MASVTGYQSIQIDRLTPHIGAQMSGAALDNDLSNDLSNEQFSEIYKAWLDWNVLSFRDQHLNGEQHKAFARGFSTLHVHPMQHSYGGDPEILRIKTTKDSKYTTGNGWHTDVTCDVTCDETPPMASALHITETPKHGGGDTLFANMYPA